MKIINLIAGIALLVGLSVEILSGNRTNYSTWYMWLQFTVCAIFIGDFLYNLFSRNTNRLPTLSWLFLLMSIPYLNILSWMDINLGRVVDVTLGVLPLLRSFVAMAMVVQWLVESKVAGGWSGIYDSVPENGVYGRSGQSAHQFFWWHLRGFHRRSVLGKDVCAVFIHHLDCYAV